MSSFLDKKIKLLKELVEINSGSQNHSGVAKVQQIVEKFLLQLGFEIEKHGSQNGNGFPGKILTGFRQGESSRTVTLVTHADTVFPLQDTFQHFELSQDGKTAVGPGIIDDKGSLLVALGGLEKFLTDKSRLSLRFLCTPSEEVGSVGFEKYFKMISKQSYMILGFEPALERGQIIDSRQGGRWYRVQVFGKEAHAGRAHKQGVNAAHELSIKLDKLQRLTDYRREVTVSIGSIQGGDGKVNTVCGYAEAMLDTRFPTEKLGKTLHCSIGREIKKVYVTSADKKLKAKTRCESMAYCPPLPRAESAKPFIDRYLKILGHIEGKRTVSTKSGGGADSSHMARPNLIVFDGLGAVGGGAHTSSEYIVLESLDTRSTALAEYLGFVNKRFAEK